MTITGSANLAIVLCKALGLDPSLTTRIDLSITSDKLPQLVVTRYVSTDATDRLKRMQFEIVSAGPSEEDPFDLDAMCASAFASVLGNINDCVFYAHEQTRKSFKEARRACYERWWYMDQVDWAFNRHNPYRGEFVVTGNGGSAGGYGVAIGSSGGGGAGVTGGYPSRYAIRPTTPEDQQLKGWP